METDWTQIIHTECGLPVEFCICPTSTITHHTCCDDKDCEMCEGLGEYFIMDDVPPIEIKDAYKETK